MSETYPTGAEASAAAGPSKPPASPMAKPIQDDDESRRVKHSLSSYRRRSISRVVLSHVTKKSGKKPEEALDLPEDLAEGIEEEEVTTDHQQRMKQHHAGRLDRYHEEAPNSIEVRTGKQAYNPEEEDEGGGLKKDEKQQYVWDVLFENQRGVYLLGKAYFSSSSLLPIDPSAFTLPSTKLPSAISNSVTGPTKLSFSPQDKDKAKAKPIRPIRTAYTLESYQTPSPAWIWITPWMVNMKTGTDEAGWKYNVIFKKDGWKDHAGPAGWWGWVRRREWVRLRCIAPAEVVRLPKTREEIQGTRGLKEVMKADTGVDGVIKAMARLPLDRQRLDQWKEWLDRVNEADLARVQRGLNGDGAVQSIARSFTHHTTQSSLYELFSAHNLSVPMPPSRSASHTSITTPTSPSLSHSPPVRQDKV